MGNGVLRYKGYCAKPEYDPEDGIVYGKILGIDDLVDFYSDSAKEVEEEFHKAVDDYIVFCEEIGKEPQKSYSGTFNIRISAELHREAALCAQIEGKTLNSFVERAISAAVDRRNAMDRMSKTATMAIITIPQPIATNPKCQFENESDDHERIQKPGSALILNDAMNLAWGKAEKSSVIVS